MDKEPYFIPIILAVTSLLVLAIGRASDDEKADNSTVTEPATIETQIPLGKIVCTKPVAHDNCLEYIIYRTVKE